MIFIRYYTLQDIVIFSQHPITGCYFVTCLGGWVLVHILHDMHETIMNVYFTTFRSPMKYPGQKLFL